ncbi:HpaII family restriction endonuclease [Winogradskyella sp. DF17]|uniref:HpaII family restriction endonuclease n=1 Tax=Winogradskyella pelagia TaxID=2819984 RepID=A0ABS3T222_9FLAO|nr:HpaII family restriction endonuclease [Winogradskyella sp. DF17]MBO3116798.1 HpaII family restriction endonuclease [Winogradskyella sp. DF17]
MITGNKGEWSEIYALFKLLGDKQLFLGNKDIEKLEGLVYPIIKILRSENNGDFEYSIKDELILISGEQEILKIPIEEFKTKAIFLLDAIKENRERTFSIPEIEEFMQSINCMSLKASSSAKTDITIVVHDQRTNQQPTLGFSIKSQLGSPSTLLNAGKTTNFIFKINGVDLTAKQIEDINSISTRSKIIDRIAQIQSKGGSFEFLKTERQIFSNNLVLIDSLLPQILSQIVFDFYSNKFSQLTDLVKKISEKNPLDFDIENEHEFYEYKIKRFLTDVALGMMPSKVWSGKYDATGGYLIVKENGDVLCYHVYNRNEFEDYLFTNTKLDTASSSRHDFGKIYIENGSLYFKLNLQIRFV